MDYQITSDNIDLSPSMVELAKSKLSKLENKISDIPQESRTFRVVMNSAPNQNFSVKVELLLNGKKFFTDETSFSLESALILSVEELERMIEKEQNHSRKWSVKRAGKRFLTFLK